jgi:hypothetical protein
MKFKFQVPEALSKVMNHKSLLAQKHSPTVLFGAGIVGIVATTVVACRATLKLDEILQKDLTTVAEIKMTTHDDYSENDRTRDLAFVYTRSALGIAKLYAPAVALGAISVTCLTSSHKILTNRNTGLMMAYAGLEKGFNEYRSRVLEEVGEEKERDLRYGTEVVQTTQENGVVTSRLKNTASIYGRFFDESNRNWVRTNSHNQMFINTQQTYANQLLQSRGHVFLNEIYDALGLPRTKEGQLVGWVLGNGDDYIDFGIFANDPEAGRRFMNGDERSVFLDFNVDGVVWNLI